NFKPEFKAASALGRFSMPFLFHVGDSIIKKCHIVLGHPSYFGATGWGAVRLVFVAAVFRQPGAWVACTPGCASLASQYPQHPRIPSIPASPASQHFQHLCIPSISTIPRLGHLQRQNAPGVLLLLFAFKNKHGTFWGEGEEKAIWVGSLLSTQLLCS